MIDNFDKIMPLMVFPKQDDSFYFVQILQRKKDHKGVRLGGANNNSRTIKTYYIKSTEQLQIHKEEIIRLCEVFNARAGINLNPRSFEKAGFQVMEKIANQMLNKNYQMIYKAYDSICGNYHSEMDKRWLVDIDTKDDATINKIIDSIESEQNKIKNRDYKILAKLETKSGFHIITNPFNLDRFTKENPGIDVHKNNPTALYIL